MRLLALPNSFIHRAAALLSAALVFADVAGACTRVVYLGPQGRVLTGRTMDWKEDIRSNLWVLPRGVARTGEAGPASLKWTSKYGSVVTACYEISTCDGMNEAGLVANLLFLAESKYPDPKQAKAPLAISLWAQYMLDNFATVAEAVADSRKERFAVVTDAIPGQQRLATLHLSLSDASGDSAIFEYIGGKLKIHHGRQYQVMTNSPVFDEQLALVKYWEQIGGEVMLPGTNRAADRFARASFYIKSIPQTDDRRIAAAGVFSVIRNCSVPWGFNTPNEPNIASTRWRTVADHKDRLYYFESAVTPNVFWVDLKKIDFAGGARTLQLGADQSNIFAGEVSGQFQAAAPFRFLGLR